MMNAHFVTNSLLHFSCFKEILSHVFVCMLANIHYQSYQSHKTFFQITCMVRNRNVFTLRKNVCAVLAIASLYVCSCCST